MDQNEPLTSLKTLRESLQVNRSTIYRHAQKLDISTQKKIKNQSHFTAEEAQRLTDSIKKQQSVAPPTVASVADPATNTTETAKDTTTESDPDKNKNPDYLLGQIAELRRALEKSQQEVKQSDMLLGQAREALHQKDQQILTLSAPPPKKGFIARLFNFATKDPEHWKHATQDGDGETIDMEKPKPD